MPSRAERRDLQEQQRRAKIAGNMTDAATTFILVRHGETTWNSVFRIQGQTNEVPLNDLGHRQAATLAQALKDTPIDAVYSSDLLRAVQTAEAILSKLGLPLCTDERLRERHMGALQGLTRAEAAQEIPGALAALHSTDVKLPIPGGGESVSAFSSRVTSCLSEIAGRHVGKTVLLVTHGGVLGVCHMRAVGRQYKGRHVNGAINRIKVEGDAWLAVEWGRVDHLADVGFQKAGVDADTGV